MIRFINELINLTRFGGHNQEVLGEGVDYGG